MEYKTMRIEQANELLQKAIEEIKKIEGIDLGEGKRYTTVDQRLNIFRKHFGLYAKTKVVIVENDVAYCRAECIISFYLENNKGESEWVGVANANAIEYRNKSQINAVSYVENAETSALGRALRFLGLFGETGASAEEVEKVNKSKKENKSKAKEHSPKIKFETLKTIKSLIEDGYVKEDQILKSRQLKKLEDLTEDEAIEIINIVGDDDAPL